MPPSTAVRSFFAACVVVGAVLLLAAAGSLVLEVSASQPAADAASADRQEAEPDLPLPERLELDGLSRHDVVAVGPDAGRAVQRDGAAMDAAYRRYLLEERLAAATSDEERARALADAIEASNATVRDLRQRERQALDAYASDDLSAAQLVGVLSSVDARASEEIEVVSATNDHARRLAIPGVGPRADAYTAQLMVRQGEVRERLGESIAADRSSQRTYVAVGERGVVLATVDGRTYHREANRHDNHRATLEQGVGTDVGWQLPSELYPQFTDLGGFTSVNWGETNRQLYRASGDYEHGTVWSYLDAHTQSVAREYQTLQLDDRLPTFAPSNATAGSLRVSVERTYPSGPARITVTDAGEPVQGATVAVANETVATTDEDGRAWVVLPYGSPRVETTADGTRLVTTVEWSDR